MATAAEIEQLAAEIGENVYLDIAKWHLYLSDAHLHIPLAEQLYPMLEENRLDEAAVKQTLERILVPVGGGKISIPLAQLISESIQADLIERLEEFQRQL